jgi:hypothetical protein
MIYMFTFYVHFALQTDWNVGASGMSVGYQQSLKGGDLPPAFQGTRRSLFNPFPQMFTLDQL